MQRPARIEVLAIGDELLDGRVADTNTLRLASALSDIGLTVSQRSTVVDDIDVIVREARAIIGRGTELCIVSGGLGPTRDDLTSEAFATLAGVELERDDEQVRVIEAMLGSRGRPISDNQLKQADRPRGSEVIPNPVGTAPGFAITVGGCRFVSVPGVPREFDRLIADHIIAPLTAGADPLDKRQLICFGVVEADADAKISAIYERWPDVRVGFRAHMPTIHVSLRAPKDKAAELDAARDYAREQLGRYVFAEKDVPFAAVILEMLRGRNETLAVAESCTGGLVSDLLTDIPGSSDVFLFGAVAYSNASKQSVLGVSADTLAEHGAVSEACVREMAAGVRERAGATYGLAVSGIAGPGGGTPDKPVGTVWLAGSGPSLDRTFRLSLPFDRERNKLVGAYGCLDLLRRSLI